MENAIPSTKRSAEKRFSLSIKNLDLNTHRAYKLAFNDHEETRKILRNPHMILKENKDMRYPFGFTDQRFRWQTSANLGENMELTGKLNRKRDTSQNQDNSLNAGSWESLMQKTEENKKVRNRSAREERKVRIEHEKTKRTMIPQLNSDKDDIQIKSGKKRPPTGAVSKATGSIINLIEKTPENKIKTKKYAGRMNEGNKIFTPVGFQKLSNKSAKPKPEYITGSRDPLNINAYEEKNRNNSVSRVRRIELLDSDIFNMKRDNDGTQTEKRVRARVISSDDKFNPYKNHQSSIVF